MEAEELRIGIKNIEDRAYSMMYYNQKLRSAKDCRRISIAKDNDIIRLMEQYAKEQAVEFADECQNDISIAPNKPYLADLYDQFKQQSQNTE